MATARAVAAKVGIPDNICTAESLHAQNETSAAQYDVFAGVLPEDKFQLVRALQRAGHITGMTGDGVNDAPALKQAEVGIAVASATDVAKAAASIILTNPGLMNAVEAVESSRRIYQRMLTYTLNKIIKTIEIAVFLSVGVMLTHTLVLTPLLIVLLLFTNDFVTMSIATDRVRFSKRPERWHIRALMLTALPLAGFLLLFTFAAFFTARDLAHLPLTELQTMMFVLLVFSGQGTVYLVRERRHLWHSAPSRWLLASSASDMLIVTLLATRGILMAPVSLALIAILAAALCVYLLLMDFFKIYMFKQFGVH